MDGGEAANGSRPVMVADDALNNVASTEPTPAERFPKERIEARGLPSFSFFLKMLVNIFLKLPEEVGNRDPLSNDID